ncbi:TetR/AcrR family transcriptional regulator C-terminal ligand-binding domain-containing protein [Streptomyces sp. N2-109]|uniref:TetR/AcrR family transcriptional regulator C-terminal ligand-binding domain-containing protein n=1 Tax=Streptomyces gossypii TaxID=2883101 RepID=A0ABT2K3Q8_9ACTN|nr:TetR/AcrR family transcriptional regulator C-terminal ligand-binding domain-containing protein [Streptomyces gossypii]MCT2594802.1 TetR/AcrR family transcriptional regulator C-terminal ligand-binding domain-containing protein [Streptomyces gossypii]
MSRHPRVTRAIELREAVRQRHGHLDLAMDILSGPLYFRLLITHQPLTHDHIDRVLRAVFTGMSPRST